MDAAAQLHSTLTFSVCRNYSTFNLKGFAKFEENMEAKKNEDLIEFFFFFLNSKKMRDDLRVCTLISDWEDTHGIG